MTALALLSVPTGLAGQDLRIPGAVRIGAAPADSGTVVLHRVSPDAAGEVDSIAVGADGRFELSLPPAASEGTEVFFASLRYDGILYFGGAIHDPTEVDSIYTIQAYPALEVDGSQTVPVRVRNIFAEISDAGWTVTDLFEVTNRGTATLVAAPGGSTWFHRLPAGAAGFQVGQSDLTLDETRFEDGRVSSASPITPGESVYLMQYQVPTGPLRIPSDSPLESFEFLVREPAPGLTVSGLAQMEPVEVEGTTYRRYAGTNLTPTLIEVVPGAQRNPVDLIPWLGAGLALLLAVAGGLLSVRRRSAGGRRAILVQVARLDEQRAAGLLDDDAYEDRREALLRGLGP